MRHCFARALLSVGALLPASVALAADSGPAAPTPSEGVAASAPETQQSEQQAITPAAAPQPVPAAGGADAAKLAALKKEILDEVKQEMAAQQAMAQMTASEDLGPKQEVVRIYGWTDMGYNKAWTKLSDPLLHMQLPTRAGTFALGNVNMYFDLQPTQNWSSLVEVRFTTLPKGSESAGFGTEPMTRTDTTVSDTGSSVPWSRVATHGLVLERAYTEYRYNDYLQVRLGRFLTPFGIWNVDHGMPTLIAIGLPEFMIQQVFPRVQTGLQLLGNTRVGEWTVGYSGYVSNGRNPGEVDPTEDKMFGGRITASTSRPWRLQLGVSALTGRYSDTQRVLSLANPMKMEIVYSEVAAYREVDVGLDASLDVGNLRLRTELARGQYVYEQGKRPGAYGSFTANSSQLSWYFVAAYRLPWVPIEPYLAYEYFRFPLSGVGEGYMNPSVGMNIYFTPYAQLKVQYIQQYFFKHIHDFTRAPDSDKQLLSARLVLGF